MKDSTDLIKRLRLLRRQERGLRNTLVTDLRAFQKVNDDLSFFTLPISSRQDISVASTCTGLMALVDCNELDKWDPEEKQAKQTSPSSITAVNPKEAPADSPTGDEKSGGNQTAIAKVVHESKPPTPAPKPASPKELIIRTVEANWKSSGLRDLNAFTTCMVIRAIGFLVSGDALTAEEAKELVHKRPAQNDKSKTENAKDERGEIEKALGDNQEPTLLEIIQAVAEKVPNSLRISTYPPKATMAYWFVDGITRAGIDIAAKHWEQIAIWAVTEFDAQLRYVASGNDPLMDPASLAMSAALIRRLRRTFHASPELSHFITKLPGRVELTHAIEQVFAKQTDSGIWHKYFPLFHFPTSGAADYTFSFEILEAILLEFSDYDILAKPGILDRVERAVRWCDNNRFEYRYGSEVFRGWNAGGDVDNLAAGMPEAWATACVHMFLWELESAISTWLQTLVLGRFPRTEWPSVNKWDELIDVDINIPPSEPTTLKTISEQELLQHAKERTKHLSDSQERPLKQIRFTAEDILRKKPLKGRRSALLFGPPGTSKTSFAKAIAGQLDWPMIIVTPSDFLSSGLEQIYVRATELFDDLMDLAGVVILFDEMDALAQTRVNPALDVTRQLLTTSMLPKLADLYEQARVIYLMATNHKKDLDPAITRPGRFDLLLCVGPPNWKRKVDGIKQALKNLPVGDFEAVQTILRQHSDSPAAKEQLDLFTVGDFRSFVEALRREKKRETLLLALQDLDRDTFQKRASEWAKSYITLSRTDKISHDEEIDAATEFELDKGASRIQ